MFFLAQMTRPQSWFSPTVTPCRCFARIALACRRQAQPLHIKDADEFLEGIAGLYLFALAYVPSSEDTPAGCMEFVFAPSLDEADLGDELPEDSQSLMLHLDSVRGIG
jgi:hypothetical protein